MQLGRDANGREAYLEECVVVEDIESIEDVKLKSLAVSRKHKS